MDRRFAVILAFIVLVAGAFMLFKKDAAVVTSAQPTNHITGTSDKNITLVEYGDFECPACGQYYPVITQLKADFSGKVAFQFRHYPLESIHKSARIASRYAEAAAKQGKFFEMHDVLYENQTTWANTGDPTTLFVTYAEQLGLDIAKLKTDAASAAINDIINADKIAGDKFNITGTPTFILNGEKISNPSGLEPFRKVINDVISAKGGTPVTSFSDSAGSSSPVETTQTTETSSDSTQ